MRKPPTSAARAHPGRCAVRGDARLQHPERRPAVHRGRPRPHARRNRLGPERLLPHLRGAAADFRSRRGRLRATPDVPPRRRRAGRRLAARRVCDNRHAADHGATGPGRGRGDAEPGRDVGHPRPLHRPRAGAGDERLGCRLHRRRSGRRNRRRTPHRGTRLAERALRHRRGRSRRRGGGLGAPPGREGGGDGARSTPLARPSSPARRSPSCSECCRHPTAGSSRWRSSVRPPSPSRA